LVTAIRGSSSQQTPLLIVGATSKGDQMSLVSAINKPGLTHGLSSVGVINEIASSLGGKGGGKPEMAQGNLTKSVHLPVLIKVITDWLVSIRTTK
jgi:alanyl-tRNA synthetase